MALSQDKEKREKQLANLKPFTGGDDPRRGVGKKRKPFLEAIEKYIEEHPEDVRSAILAVFKNAKRGDLAALHTLMDRIDGPITSKQQIEFAADEQLLNALDSGRKRIADGDANS